jgi:hypothetical protein
MVACILANGKTIVAKEKESLLTLTTVFMKEILFVTKPKEKVCLTILMVRNTKAIGKIMKEKVVEYYLGKMAKNMMEAGSIIRNKDTDSCFLEMEAFTKVNSTLIKYMVGDSILGTNRKNIMDNGSIIRCAD